MCRALVSLGFSVHLLPDVVVTLEPQPAWLGALCGIVVAGLFGFAIGKVAFKVRGAYFVIVTISFAEVVRLVALNWDELTARPDGAEQHPARSRSAGRAVEITFIGKLNYYYLVLAVAIIAYVIIARIVHSRAGRAMIALKENEALAASVGVDVTRYLVFATVVSAAIAGAAGVLYAHYVRIVDPNIFLFIYTVTMVIMVVAGGKGTLSGPIVGGLIFGLLPESLRSLDVAPELQWVIYGVLMILVVYLLPQGIVPALGALARRRRAEADLPSGVEANARGAAP